MANKELRPYFDRCLVALAIVFAIGLKAAAQDENLEEEKFDPNALVEVYIKADPQATYSAKKSNWSYRLSASYEEFYPSNYVSQADGASYDTLFGSNQGYLATTSLGLQYNTRIGGLYVDAQYGGGSIAGAAGTNGSMTVKKYGATVGYSLNTLSKDPWVSPFIAEQIVYFSWNETATGNSGQTAATLGTMIGISIHLNKIDTDAAKDAYEGYGLKNTALDIYAVQYATSSSATDPDFETDFNIGAGFHFEF